MNVTAPTFPKTPAAERRKMADELKESLLTYHQFDGRKNGSKQDGIQGNPLVAGGETELRGHLDLVSDFVSNLENVAYRPSPQSSPGRSNYRKDLAARSAKWVANCQKTMLEQTTNLISDPSIRQLVKLGLDQAPAEFYEAPSSSSGRYHPADEINKGGLVLHTERVVTLAQELGNLYQVTPKERDLLTASLILHDSCKGGVPWRGYAVDHGDVAANLIANLPGGNTEDGKTIQRLAANHMAQWSKDASNKHSPRPPADKLEQIVSYSDYLASQDNIYLSSPNYNAEYLNDQNRS